MGQGFKESGEFQATPHPNRQRPRMPANYWAAENERIGGAHTFQAAYSRSGNTTVRTTLVPWQHYPQAIKSILGYSFIGTFGSNQVIERVLPWRDPVDHGLFAQSVTVRGLSPDGYGEWVWDESPGTSRWPLQTHSRFLWAELTITFGTLNYELAQDREDIVEAINAANGEVIGKQPDVDVRAAWAKYGPVEQMRYCVKDVREGREFVQTLPGTFVLASPGTDDPPTLPIENIAAAEVKFPIPQVLSFSDITVTWLDVPELAVPWTAISRALGRVNDEMFQLPGTPPPAFYGPETLLFQSYSVQDVFWPGNEQHSATYNPESRRAFNVTYHFRFRGRFKANGNTDEGITAPNWNKVPIPLLDGNRNTRCQFRRVFRKPLAAGYPLRSGPGAVPMGIFDVFRFDYLFRVRMDSPFAGDPF